VGTKAYDDAIKKVTDAIAAYTASIVDLGVALDLELLVQARDIQTSVDSVKKQVGELSHSTETQLQALHSESKSTFVMVDRLLQETTGNRRLCLDSKMV